MQGIIRKVKPTYFFILIENDREVFAHLSGWLSKDAPREFDEVEFDLIPSHKPQFKEQAVRVRKIVIASPSAVDTLAGAGNGDKAAI